MPETKTRLTLMTMKNKKIMNLGKNIASLVLLSMVAVTGWAQHTGYLGRATTTSEQSTWRKVTGKVTDASTGDPLVGISIQVYGKPGFAAMTDEAGVFTISVPEYVQTLTAQAEGYALVMTPIDNKTNTVAFVLYADAFSANYPTRIRPVREVEGPVDDLNADLSIDRQIQTGLGGSLRTINRSGQQGMGALFLMDGINSLMANAQPLVVIDGVIYDMQYNRASLHDGFYNNLLANIDVSDIDRVRLVKNGLALYGAKGANGVLLIDTKRSRSMATRIDVDVTGSFEQVPNLPTMMDASDYRYYASELLGTTGTKLTEFKFLNTDPSYFYYKKFNNNTDWTKEVYREAFSQLYGINVQGGDEVASYHLSVGYADANSTLKYFTMDRFNLRLNTDLKLSRKLDVRFDASYSDVNRVLRDDGVADDVENTTVTSVGLLGLIKAPFLNPYEYDIYGNLSGYYADADDYLDEVIGSEVSLANPTSLLFNGEGKNKNMFGNRMVNLAIMPVYRLNRQWTIREHFSYTMVNTSAFYYTPRKGMPSLVIEDVGTVENMAKSMAATATTFSSDTRVDWLKNAGAHDVHIYGGARLLRDTYDMNSIQGYNSTNDKSANISMSLTHKSTYGVDDEAVSLTYYAMGDYRFRDTYFLSGGLSLNASSNFGRDVTSGVHLFGVPWGLFSSINGAWLMTAEPWFKPNNTLNYLKLNVGFDVSGNDDLDCTATNSYFSAVRVLNSIGGLTLGNIGNSTLQWETTKRLTAGMDMNLFTNRLSVTANVFKSKTDDLLSLKALGYIGGLHEIWSNDGSLSNTGYDLSMTYRLLNFPSLKMEVGASAAHYNNKITALPGGKTAFTTDIYGATILSQVGSPVGLFYGYKTDGVYATTAEALADGKYIVLRNGEKKYFGAGDMNFVSDDALVDEADRVVIGDPNPDLYGHLFTKLNYKRLSLNAVFTYSLGNDVFNYQRMILEGGHAFINQTTALNNRWTTEGQKTTIPVIRYEDPMGNSRFSDRWIEVGSYLKLKTVTLSYTLPVFSTYLQGFTVWASVNNLMTWTKYLGADPEASLSNSVLLQGIDRGLLAQGRNVAFGIKINI